MWTAIIDLYQGSSEAKKLVLKDKQRTIKMSKLDYLVSYLTKFTQVRDKLAGSSETVTDRDLVSFSLMGFTKARKLVQMEYVPGRSFQTRSNYGVIVSKKKFADMLSQGLVPR